MNSPVNFLIFSKLNKPLVRLLNVLSHNYYKFTILYPHDTKINQQIYKEISNNFNANFLELPLMSNDKETVDLVRILSKSSYVLGISYFFPQIIRSDVFSLPTRGTINLHPAPLPKYRGANILNWMLINGETQGCCTMHILEDKIDSGGIIDSIDFPIEDKDDINVLRSKSLGASISLIKNNIPSLLSGDIEITKQNLNEGRYYKRRIPADGIINWSMKAFEIYNLVRALCSPWPGAFFYLNEKKIIIDKASIVYDKIKEPGVILIQDKENILVSCSDYYIKLEQISFENKILEFRKFIFDFKLSNGLKL